jgi:hypothetical protein
MVVVDPDQVIPPQGLEEQPAEAAVHARIGLPVRVSEPGQVDAVVEDGPERAIGVAQVVALVLGLGEVSEGELDIVLGDHANPARLALRRLARPPEPQAAAALGQGVPEGDGQTARALLARSGSSVRGDNKTAHRWLPEEMSERRRPKDMRDGVKVGVGRLRPAPHASSLAPR